MYPAYILFFLSLILHKKFCVTERKDQVVEVKDKVSTGKVKLLPPQLLTVTHASQF